MASSEEELNTQLVEVGSKLQRPPSSVKDLLALLDRVEVYLSRVEQSPPKSIQTALSPTLKALVGEDLLRHEDTDVKVAVASCISEITRITAPEVPYEDDQMREVFQLIVSSFESLADESSKSYSKRTSILETVAKVRSCVVMLDLECDALILEMFRHFIKAIRDYHPENVYSGMESIMIRVIEESEEISPDLLICIMETVKKDNEGVTPVARKMMENVMENCTDKLRPYIESFVKNRSLSVADYSAVVNRICNEPSTEKVIQTDETKAAEVLVTESKSAQPPFDTAQVAEETYDGAITSTEELSAVDGGEKLVTSNGTAGAEVDVVSGSCTVQDEESSHAAKASEVIKVYPAAEVYNSDSVKDVQPDRKSPEAFDEDTQIKVGDLDNDTVDEKESNIEPKTEKIVKRRGRKPKTKKNASALETGEKSSGIDAEKLDELPESHKSISEVTCPSPRQESSNEAGLQSATDKQVSSSKPSDADDIPSKGVTSEAGELEEKLSSHLSKTVVSKSENDKFEVEKTITAAVIASEERTDPTVCASEVRTVVFNDDAHEENVNAPNTDATPLAGEAAQEVAEPAKNENMEEAESSDLKAKLPELSSAGLEEAHNMKDGSVETKDDMKKRGRGLSKATLHKLATQEATPNTDKEATNSKKLGSKSVATGEDHVEITKTGSKRKRTGATKNVSKAKDYGEEVVGSHVKIWWPADQEFYKGVIESFDSTKKKHKVLYADGETEELVLRRQTWALINPGEESDSDEDSGQETPNDTPGKRQKGKEADEGTSNSGKRLGRPPSNKSKSASIKRGPKPKDLVSDGKSRDDSKSNAKTKTDGPKDEVKSKGETVKKAGRPRADASQSAGKGKADESSSKAAGKFQGEESKRTGKSAMDDAKSSGKNKVGDSKSGSKSKDESKTASKSEAETSVKKKNAKEKDARSADETSALKSARKSKTSTEPNKSRSGLAAKQGTKKADSAAKNKGKSPKTSKKTDERATEKADSSSSDSEASKDEEEKTPTPVKAAASSKRKAPVSKKGIKSEAKSRKKLKGSKQ